MNENTPTAETLLQHSGWLKALALRLLQDASRADVVQQAFLPEDGVIRNRPLVSTGGEASIGQAACGEEHDGSPGIGFAAPFHGRDNLDGVANKAIRGHEHARR